MLEQEGFVRSVPRRGIFVIRKSKREIIELIQVWAALESMAARLAAENRTVEQVASLRDLIKRQNEFFDYPDHNDGDPEVFNIGPSIYNTIGEATGNRLLGSFVSAVSRVAIGVYLHELTPEKADKARALTGVLVEAIAAGDPDAAEATMTELLEVDESATSS